jgi:MFS family permease
MTDKTGIHRRMALPRTAAYWLVAGVLVLSLFAATAPSPLYRVYQHQLRFSVLTLTAIFAVYSVAVLITLLMFGSVSDHVGRRPVIVATLVVNMGGRCSWRRMTSACWSPPASCRVRPSARGKERSARR